MKRTGDDCSVCRQLRLDGPDKREFCVAPSDGGGWQVWSAALLHFIENIAFQPTQAVIIDQTLLCQRYVQVMIGHGIAYAEAGSNVYPTGDSQLSKDHEQLLRDVGWRDPIADHDTMGANWTLPIVEGDWPYLVEILLATLVGVFGLSEHLPVEVRCHGCAHPCRDCSWPDEFLSKSR